MIEINLLPEELKAEPKSKKIGVGLQPKQILSLIPFIFGILICMHFCLLVVNVIKGSQFNILNNKWQKFEPQRKILDGFSKEYALLSEDALASQQFVGQRINWSEKLNNLSLKLPSGVWLNEIIVSQKDFIVRGSVVSLKAEEMNLVKIFIDNLKNNTAFIKDFDSLELGSVQRRTVGGYDIVDFNLAGDLKPR